MKNNLTIQSLRQNGYKVLVRHYRQSSANGFLYPKMEFVNDHLSHLICPKGGKVEIEIYKDNIKGYGVSLCHANDHFVRRWGNIRALGRAYSDYLKNFTKTLAS